YSIEYQEDNYDGYYGEGYDVDPGYVYVAKGKDIMALNEYFMGKSSATIISPISKEYSEIHKEVLQYKK
ncbi:MAG: hypothetical protein IKU45_06210, partial [Clostridia bacterium]|nr:hypothetical protein [Clostridia bacterium]